MQLVITVCFCLYSKQARRAIFVNASRSRSGYITKLETDKLSDDVMAAVWVYSSTCLEADTTLDIKPQIVLCFFVCVFMYAFVRNKHMYVHVDDGCMYLLL